MSSSSALFSCSPVSFPTSSSTTTTTPSPSASSSYFNVFRASPSTNTTVSNYTWSSVTVCSDTLYILGVSPTGCILSRWKITESTPTTTPLPSCDPTDPPTLFTDPTGSHLLLSHPTGAITYAHTSSLNTLLPLKKWLKTLNGATITAVAYSPTATPQKAKPILLGTSTGQILLATLPDISSTSSTVSGPAGKEGVVGESCRVLMEAGEPISSLYYTATSTTYTVLALTTSSLHTRFHSFTVPNAAITAQGGTAPLPPPTVSRIDLPGTLSGAHHATLRVHNKTFAVLTAAGIFHGTIAATPPATGAVTNTTLLMYSELSVVRVPVDIIITQNHFILVQGGDKRAGGGAQCEVVSRISWSVIERVKIVGGDGGGDEASGLRVLCDARRPGAGWCVKGQGLWHVSSGFEERDVWRLRLQKIVGEWEGMGKEEVLEEFDAIVKGCSKSTERNAVGLVRGRFLVDRQDWAEGGRCLARLGPGGGTVASHLVSLIKAGDVDNAGVVAFLFEWFTRMEKGGRGDVRCAMVGAWLVELMMARRYDGASSAPKDGNNVGAFLAQYARVFDAATTLKILKAHGAGAHEVAAAAAASGDLGVAVGAALSVKSQNGGARRGGAVAAIKILEGREVGGVEGVYWRHAKALFERAPAEAGESFLRRYKEGLKVEKVLPALMHVYKKAKGANAHAGGGGDPLGESEEEDSSSSESEDDAQEQISGILRYLEGCVKLGCRLVAVHNFLVTMYVDMSDSTPLFRYLNDVTSSHSACMADKSYALRSTLRSSRHHRSAVKLYMAMGMQKEAVELALKVDPGLARELAKGAGGNERKRLWLMIAKSAAAGAGDAVARVIAELRESGGSLSIEDVLPFLPDFATIDEFKDEICSALQGYSDTVARYKEDLAEADLICEGLQEEIAWLEKQEVKVGEDERCAVSGKELGADVYAFRSGFVVRVEEMRRVVWEVLDAEQRERVEWLEGELAGGEGGEARRKELGRELDGLIAAECPCTGDLAIESIGVPLEGWDE